MENYEPQVNISEETLAWNRICLEHSKPKYLLNISEETSRFNRRLLKHAPTSEEMRRYREKQERPLTQEECDRLNAQGLTISEETQRWNRICLEYSKK